MSVFKSLPEAAQAHEEPTTIQQLLPARKTTKVDKVVVHRRTLTVQSRTIAWAAGSLFVAGFALGQWNPPVETPAGADTISSTTTLVTPSTSTLESPEK